MKHLNIQKKNLILLQIAVIILVFMATFHGLLTTGNLQAIGYIFVGHILGMMLFFNVVSFQQIRFIKLDKLFLLLWFLLSGSVFLSEIIHLEIVEAPFMLVCIPLFYFLLYPLLFRDTLLIYKVVFVLGIPLVAFVLLMMLRKHQFTTNSIALSILTAAIALLALQKELLDNKKFYLFLVSDGLSLLAFACMVYVRSRTSMLAFVVVYLVSATTNLIYLKLTKSELKNKIKIYYLFGILMIVLFFINNLQILTNLVFKWSPDISTGRTRIWKASLNTFTLFGNGYEFYRLNPAIGVGPHNALISLLAFNGPIPMIAAFVMLVKLFYDFFFTHQLKENFLQHKNLILVTSGFLVCGMFEGLFHIPIYRPINLLWFMELGAYYIKTNKLEVSENSLSLLKSKWLLIGIILIATLSLTLVEGDANIFSILKMAERYF